MVGAPVGRSRATLPVGVVGTCTSEQRAWRVAAAATQPRVTEVEVLASVVLHTHHASKQLSSSSWYVCKLALNFSRQLLNAGPALVFSGACAVHCTHMLRCCVMFLMLLCVIRAGLMVVASFGTCLASGPSMVAPPGSLPCPPSAAPSAHGVGSACHTQTAGPSTATSSRET